MPGDQKFNFMANVLLVVSAILFIITLGIHARIMSREKVRRPYYTRNPVLTSIPIVSGYILPVIPFAIVFEVPLVFVFFINLIFAYLLGQLFTKTLLAKLVHGKGLAREMIFLFTGALIIMIIGIVIR